MEKWKPVKGFENYEVSDMGNIKSLNYNHTGEAKILKPGKQRGGYLYINLYKNAKRYSKKIHRLVAEAFIPNPEGKPQVNHIDGNKKNNKLSNLEWSTNQENQQHAYNTGLHVITEGTKKKMSKARKGKQFAEEHKRKLSENHADFKGEKHPKARKVICITTCEIFDYIGEAQEKYNVDQSNISKCCRGKQKSAGKHPVTGEKLVWRYEK